MDNSFVLRKFKKSIAGFTILALLASFVSFAGVALASFDDTSGHWAEDYINDLVDMGVVSGYEDGTFGPDDTLTRGQLAKIAVLAFLGEDLVETDEGVFDDVSSDAWYADYVYTAYLYGLVSGYDDTDGESTGKFGPDDEVNRAAAAKILVNAAGLSLTTAGGPHFDDVDSDAWYYEYVETAYLYSVLDGYGDGDYGPGDAVTRGQVAKMTMNALSPTYRGDDDDDDDDDTTTSAGGLTVALSSDTPEGATVPDGATSLPVVTWDFTANGDDVEIDELHIHQSSISSLSTDHQLYLYEGGTRLTSGTTINSSTFEGKFNNLNLEVEDGETRSFTVRFDVGTSNSGDELAVELESASSVVADTDDVNGNFPLTGETFSIVSDAAGTVTVSKNGTVTNPKVGDDDVVIAKFKIAAATEAAELEQIGLLLTGTISTSDVENFELYVSGEDDAVATVAAVNSSDLIDFVLDTPYEIEKGGSKSFTVKADFNTGRTSDTVKVYLDESTDIVATGGTYGYGMQVTRGDYDDGSADGTDASWSTLQGGDVTISSSGPSADTVAINGKDVTLLNFSITAVGEVTFKKFPIALTASEAEATEGLLNSTAANFTDIKVSNADTGDELMTSFDATALVTGIAGSTAVGEFTGAEGDAGDTDDDIAYHIYTDNFTMDAGEELNLTLSADIANTSTLDAMTIYASLPLGDNASYPEIRDVNNKTLTNTSVLVPTSTITGKTMTLSSPSLTMSLASTPVSGSNVFVKGSKDVQFTGMVFTCGASSDCTVTDMNLYGAIDEDAGGTLVVGKDNDTNVNDVVGSVSLQYSDGTEVASAAGVTGTTGLISFTDIGWTIDAGASETIYVVGDISSSMSADIVSFYVAAATDITVEDADGNTFSASGTPNILSGGASTTYVTVADGGQLTVTVASDTPETDIIVAGSSSVEISKFKIDATKASGGASEAFYVKKFSMMNRQDGVASSDLAEYANNITGVTVSYENAAGDTVTQDGSLVSGTASFTLGTGTDEYMYIPKDGYAYVTVYADLNTIADGATAAEYVELSMAFNNFEALAVSSGETYKANKLDDGVGAATDLDFGTPTWTSTTVAVDTADTTGAVGSSSTYVTADLGVSLPVGTLVAFSTGDNTTYTESADVMMVLTSVYNDDDTAITGYVANIGDANEVQAADYVKYSLPGQGYFTNTHHMYVYESKPTLALSSSSPTSATIGGSDEPFIFTITADALADIQMRDSLELTDGAVGKGTLCTPDDTITATAGQVDGTGTLCTMAGNEDGDTFAFDTGLTSMTTDTSTPYARINFWFKYTAVAGAAPLWADLAIGTSDETGAAAVVDQRTALTASACGADGTTAVTTEWYNCDLALPTAAGSNDRYVHFELVDATTRLAATDTIHIDAVRLYNEKLAIDISADTGDLDTYANNSSNAAAPVEAYLMNGTTQIAKAYVDTLTNGASATTTATIEFIPDVEFRVTAGNSKTLTLRLDTIDLLATDSGVEDPVIFSIDYGSASDASVTAGDFWWYESNATVKWLGDVSGASLTGNTLNY